jgi:CRP-like cAMP-binding protein
VLERTGNGEAAVQRYAEVVRSRPIDAESLEIHHRLARLCIESGHEPQAGRLVAGILRIRPDHEGALELAARLGVPAQRPTQSPAGDEDQALDIGVTTGGDEGRLVGVDRDFEFLRRVPLFRELSLDELKYVQSLCEKARYPGGSYIITQGQPGEALFVIARGKAAVTSSEGGGDRRLGELGPGSHVGEMSLLDEAPTSANVVALEDVNVYRLPRRRFTEILEANERIQLRIYRVMMKTLLSRLREANARLATAVPEDGAAVCLSCGELVEPHARHCPHCGKPTSRE